MVAALNDHRIEDIGEFFHQHLTGLEIMGAELKKGLKEFQHNWQVPFQKAFSNKICIDEARIVVGEWGASFGRQEAFHTGKFMGIKPTNKKVEIRYMDFWNVKNKKIVNNWVWLFSWSIKQLFDIFNGEGTLIKIKSKLEKI